MTDETLQTEARDLNLSYLMLAQAMIRDDKAQALYRLGIGESTADLLEQLSSQQLVRVASRNPLLCTFRFDDELIWGLLTSQPTSQPGDESNAGGLHASVLMAGRYAELA
jgi:flagellar transcriptional activator FlhD